MSQQQLFQLVVAVVAVTVIILALPESLRNNVFRFVTALARFSERFPRIVLAFLGFIVRYVMPLERIKNLLLYPLVDVYYRWLRLTPNRQTGLRAVCLAVSFTLLIAHRQGWRTELSEPLAWAFWIYVVGWHFDMTDGLTAKRYGCQTKLGALLDPCVDVPFSVAFSVALADRFNWPMVAYVFALLSSARILAFVIISLHDIKELVAGQRDFVLKTTPDGRLKSVIAFVALSLQMANYHGRWHWTWPDWLLAVACLLEVRALPLLYRSWRERKLVHSPDIHTDGKSGFAP